MSRTIGVETLAAYKKPMEGISVKRVASSHYVRDDDVQITGSSAGNYSIYLLLTQNLLFVACKFFVSQKSFFQSRIWSKLEVSPTIVFDEYQRMKVLRRRPHPCVIPIVDAHVFPVVDAEEYNCWEMIRSYCCDKNPRFRRPGLLDPILVHMPNGPAPVWAVRCGASQRPITSKKRPIQEAGDRGTVAEITESIRYKKRSSDTEKDTGIIFVLGSDRGYWFRTVLGRVMTTVGSFRLLMTCFSSRFMELQMCFRWHSLGLVKCVVVVSGSGCDSRVVQSSRVKSMGFLGWRCVLLVLVEIDVIVWLGMNDNGKSRSKASRCWKVACLLTYYHGGYF
ncbi:BnaA08g06570D [Brassica napus]|uniref:(rape) hypothetical protein n=1 Tax=Brassica napus TaxID=3708 RepID=A0A078I9B7_BRANA|nr:unnamed protein product [Brassica napus]CDY46451.1 BnaA08g06570D [Brassica napus]